MDSTNPLHDPSPQMSSKFNMQQKLSQLDGAEWDSSSDDEPSMSSKRTGSDKSAHKSPHKSPHKSRNHNRDFDGKKNIISLDSKNDPNNDNKTTKKRQQRKGNIMSSVIYLGHLPAGFEEEELGGFLSQFGDVIGLHVSRSKRTGNPKGYAFVKFRDAETGEATVTHPTNSSFELLL